MAISRRHLPYYKEILALPGFVAEPVLLFGFQEMWVAAGGRPDKKPRYPPAIEKLRSGYRRLRHRVDAVRGAAHRDLEVPEEFLNAADMAAFLRNRGVQDIEILDNFDKRATFTHDMNLPVPEAHHERYGTFIDIGCVEHVFDTKQCLENCLRMVRTGGHYFVHTPVNGYYGHGLHVFNPETLLGALQLNGFEIVLDRYSTRKGAPVKDPRKKGDVLIWLVARKVHAFSSFQIPQQGMWKQRYAGQDK